MMLIDCLALVIGGAVFVLIAVISWLAWPDRSGNPRDERFIPGNYHPGESASDGDGS
jgi:hypothetical protein